MLINQKKRISITFEWIFILPALIANYSIYLAVLSIIPYKGVSRKLSSYVSSEKEAPIDERSRRRANILSIGAFFTYLYFLIAPLITPNEISKSLLSWCILWMVGSLVASITLSKCLYETNT